ncbi:PP2A regulatory subunit TAP46 [Amborella trichopoda]|uniref:PP2A regulatory subunit TAP46 n=1 Tax=Amborella trichopoda TaxID=13333 RepID=UPI0009BFEFBF|nr:PP2A regulatory subunit TAP46 [Amborella trichopoda]|eukprot:XP_020527910.1 PP2A regulatory subunit TAP46 [Amborella trichopoda]
MWHRKAANQARFSKPALPITCATFALDVLEGGAKASEAHEHRHQPLTFGPASLISGNLTTEKERMAAQVFQPGYRLVLKNIDNRMCTLLLVKSDCHMSIVEAVLREMEMMKKWQETHGGGQLVVIQRWP